jgi:hypothetical protein
LYQQLPQPDSNRLLRVDANEIRRGRQTFCSLTVVASLEHAPPYEAIAYVWGPAYPKEGISCNVVNVDVTPNLARLLQYLCNHQGSSSAKTNRLERTKRLLYLGRRKRSSSSRRGTQLHTFACNSEAFLDGIVTRHIWIDALCISSNRSIINSLTNLRG